MTDAAACARLADFGSLAEMAREFDFSNQIFCFHTLTTNCESLLQRIEGGVRAVVQNHCFGFTALQRDGRRERDGQGKKEGRHSATSRPLISVQGFLKVLTFCASLPRILACACCSRRMIKGLPYSSKIIDMVRPGCGVFFCPLARLLWGSGSTLEESLYPPVFVKYRVAVPHFFFFFFKFALNYYYCRTRHGRPTEELGNHELEHAWVRRGFRGGSGVEPQEQVSDQRRRDRRRTQICSQCSCKKLAERSPGSPRTYFVPCPCGTLDLPAR